MARATPRYCRGDSYQPSATQQKYVGAVEQVFHQHRRRYGSRRIVAELVDRGHSIGRDRVRSILKAKGLVAIQRHRPSDQKFCTPHHR